MKFISVFLFSISFLLTFAKENPEQTNTFSKNKNLVKVKVDKKNSLLDFGAIGDGKTDDSQAFIKAIKAASESFSKSIYIPDGYLFNLANKNIDFNTYPNIVLNFEGGLLINGNLKGFYTIINAPRIQIFKNISLAGIFTSANDFAYPEWYGAFPHSAVDVVDAMQWLNTVFFDISLGQGNYYTQKGEYNAKGLTGLSSSSTRIIYETDKSNTYLIALGKINGLFNDRTYDYRYVKNINLMIVSKNKIRLKGNTGIIIGAVHKPNIENVIVHQFNDYQKLSKNELLEFTKDEKKITNANVGIDFRGDSEVSILNNVFTLSDVGILFSQYTDFVNVNNYMSWCGNYGLSNIYFKKEAVKSQNLLFEGSQSWNQGLYGFYSEDSNEWNTFRNNKFENVRIEQLTSEILNDGKVVSTSIRIGKSSLIANLMFDNIILSGASNGIYIGETPSGNVFFDKITANPDITVKKEFGLKVKLVKPSTSWLETPFQIHLKNIDLDLNVQSTIESGNFIYNKNDNLRNSNRFSDTVIMYEN